MTDSNVVSKLREWLDKQGYPLEMRTARAFRDTGFDVFQSHYYSDPESDSQREMDVIAVWPEITGQLEISFSIECKFSSGKPWMLFADPNTLSGRNVLFSYGVMSASARKIFVDKGFNPPDELEFMKLPWMKKEGAIGFGLTQAFTQKEDVAYKASIGSLKSAIARKLESDSKSWQPFVFSFPVIVIDDLLFECVLSDSGEIEINEITHGNLFFPISIAGESGTCINVVTADYLPQFAADAKNVAQRIHEYLEEDCNAALRRDNNAMHTKPDLHA